MLRPNEGTFLVHGRVREQYRYMSVGDVFFRLIYLILLQYSVFFWYTSTRDYGAQLQS